MAQQVFDLFLDESGDFMETSSVAGERKAASGRFPSQLAGLLVPAGELTKASATKILEAACEQAGMAFHGSLHGTELPPARLRAVLGSLLPVFQAREWLPVRLVNREAVSYGSRIVNYTNMVAELAMRCFQQLRLLGFKSIRLDLHCAVVVVDKDLGDIIQRSDYKDRLHEYLARAMVRAGLAPEQSRWMLGGFHMRSGRGDPEIMLCDLISNASKGGFERAGEALATKLRASFGDNDHTLMVRDEVDRVDALIADGAHAFALVALAETLSEKDLEPSVRTMLERRLEQVVAALAALGQPARDPQLQIVAAFLEQTISWRRELQDGRQLCVWFQRHVVLALRRKLKASKCEREVDWFDYLLHVCSLSAANHLGDLVGAAREIESMRDLQSALAERWERLDLFLQGQIYEAVHRTDARQFAEAEAIAQRVAAFHGDLSELFHAAMPGALAKRVRAKRRGDALGTAMQAVVQGASADPEHLARARRLGDGALEEFESTADRQRHFQYRCQLETVAGDFAAARGWLAKAMLLAESDPSHAAIGVGVRAAEPGSVEQGFLLLHWARLAAFATGAPGSRAEVESFDVAFAASGFATDLWCAGSSTIHPGPSILRYLGEVDLARGRIDEALRKLDLLRRSTLPISPGAALLALPLLALQTLCALHFRANRYDRTLGLIDRKDAAALGILQILQAVREPLGAFAGWRTVLDDWKTAIEPLRSQGKWDDSCGVRITALVHRLAF